MSAALRMHGELERNASLARLNTWRVGGAAECLYRPFDIEDLTGFLAKVAEEEPLFWLGFGSNVLVRDGGIKGTVITLRDRMTDITRIGGNQLRAEAGAPCAKVASLCAGWGLTGLECFAGIPGTVGGALAMNAGAFGQETWDCVTELETIDRHGGRKRRGRETFSVAYRSVQGPAQEWFTAALFRLDSDEPAAVRSRISARVAERNASQPMGIASCGSVFRNPPGDHAARLIEAAGLKGCAVGGASVSLRHANFIVNEGAATAADIEMLIHRVQSEVFERSGVRLEPEVRIVGEKLP